MKNVIALLGYMIACMVLSQLGPWWLPALAAIVAGYLMKDLSAFGSFAFGFLGLFLLWVIWSQYSSSMNDGLLATRIGALLNGVNAVALVVITGVLGGLLGGLGAISGKFTRDLLEGSK